MVCAVDRKVAAIKIKKKGATDRMSGMKLVTLFIAVRFGGGKMLDEIAAKIQADQLHALADAQNRLLFLNENIQKRKLLSVQFGIDVMTVRIEGRLFGQKQRVNIAAAGQNQSIPAGGAGDGERYLDFGHGMQLLLLDMPQERAGRGRRREWGESAACGSADRFSVIVCKFG